LLHISASNRLGGVQARGDDREGTVEVVEIKVLRNSTSHCTYASSCVFAYYNTICELEHGMDRSC